VWWGCDDSAPAPDTENQDISTADDPFADYFDDGSFILKKSHSLVIRDIEFFGQAEDGSSEGFNLDNIVSEPGDELSCGHGDLVDASGASGVDNQLSALWALIGPLVGEATHALMKGAINEGRLLLSIELSGVDDLKNDEDVTLTFFRGRADPDVGTFGLLSPDQTYYVDTEFPSTTIEKVKIQDGVIIAGPVTFQIPIDILAEFFIVQVTSGQIKITLEEDGSATGLLGGIINAKDVLDEGYETNASAEFRLVTPIFLNNTDMLPNEEGGCDGISMAVRFDATTGFVVHTPDEQTQSE